MEFRLGELASAARKTRQDGPWRPNKTRDFLDFLRPLSGKSPSKLDEVLLIVNYARTSLGAPGDIADIPEFFLHSRIKRCSE
jgi:hypothetical protein